MHQHKCIKQCSDSRSFGLQQHLNPLPRSKSNSPTMTCWTGCFWSLAHFLGILILFVKSSTPDMRFISINPTSAVWPMTENRNYLARSSCHLKIHVMLTPDIPRLTRLQKKYIITEFEAFWNFRATCTNMHGC